MKDRVLHIRWEIDLWNLSARELQQWCRFFLYVIQKSSHKGRYTDKQLKDHYRFLDNPPEGKEEDGEAS